jgi:hypothetical protein
VTQPAKRIPAWLTIDLLVIVISLAIIGIGICSLTTKLKIPTIARADSKISAVRSRIAGTTSSPIRLCRRSGYGNIECNAGLLSLQRQGSVEYRPLRALPREDHDLFIAASNGHLLAFDNVSGLPAWISDTLCRLATGGGFAVRQLYSDQDEVLFDAARPVILNGIEDIVTRPDLADRAVFLTLEPIPEDRRRPERELWAAFEAERPRILGVLLDAVAKGLAE